MFKNIPKVFAHVSSVKDSNFVLPEYILNYSNDTANLFHKYCPHRMYPLGLTGEHVNNITCKFHNFKWNKDGTPINNPRKLHCGSAEIGRSGLVFKNFKEPNHQWVDDLADEKNLVYSHSCRGESKGSWLWLMDAEADYLHIYGGQVHPRLSSIIDLEESIMDQGEGWIYQEHTPGWWSVYIYPYTFIEHTDGCLSVNYVVPSNSIDEYGFEWITQFYYDPTVSTDLREEFETLETVFREDVAVAELQKGNYFPLMKAMNRYEDHCVHFGQWFRNHRLPPSIEIQKVE